MEGIAHLAKFIFTFGLLLDYQLLQFQFHFPAAIFYFLFGPTDDLLGFEFGVFAAKVSQEPHRGKCQSGGH